MPDPSELREEIEFFRSKLPEWLKEHEGKFALVKGRQLIGTFDTAENAYVAGVERFGNVPFLIRQVVEKEPTAQLPALSLGLLGAHTQ